MKKIIIYIKRKINLDYLSKISWDEFDNYFIKTLHCLRIKSTLEDYFDLNCWHLRMTDIFSFDLKLISLVSNVEKVFRIIEPQFNLLNDSENLEKMVDIIKINNCFKNINNKILQYYNINESGSNSLKKFAQIINVEKEQKFLKFINEKFTDEFLINVMTLFENRKNDSKIWKYISDEATIPAIYEYIITIVWWKILKKEVNIYDLLKNKIDADFLPIHHTTGLKADIFFEIEGLYDIPKHTLLIEVTLSENKGQRKMELEPVHRHTLDQVIKNIDLNKTVLTYFISPNVDTIISQMFRNYSKFPIIIKDKLIEGVNIMSLTNQLLIKILQKNINYKFLYDLTINTINSSYNQKDWFKKFENNIFSYNEKNI
ncbi:AlwI family type II restriction endonuclease [Spiroplasma sp. AdecLV25b]|uniref:AlwI family type II restriction endonuclease n=1 Tax=Spiroplasma sp. AdecLV25b TaxID=3027162 RepID=UPI0027DF43EA|nr:AlwI family type II restriction endonuclease [Spiroplasma sp. AdecLV25b]